MSDYYADVLESIPFKTAVELYEQNLPRFMAVWLAAKQRFWAKIGFPPRPMYAARWDPDFHWDDRRDMPALALSRWAPKMECVEDLGFETCGCKKSNTVGCKQEANCFLLNESGNTVAQQLWLQISDIEQIVLTFVSYRTDGTEIMTSALPEAQIPLTECLVPDYVSLKFEPESTPAKKLYRIHCERPELASAMCLTQQTLLPHYHKQRLRFFEDCVQKKLLRRITDREFNHLNGLNAES